jgi:phosphatidylserine decarboxylase
MKSLASVSTLFILLITLLASCGKVDQPVQTRTYGAATTQLIDLVEKDTLLKRLLITSIQKAKEANPDTVSNPAQSLEQYYDFISKMETSMPWAYVENFRKSSSFEHIFQSLCTFYFILDQPLAELEGKNPYHNSLQYYEPIGKWLTTFNKSWRQHLDSEQSWSQAYYQVLASDPAFGLQNGWYEDPSNWKTFNQFFARHLSSSSARPIASPQDDAVVASFADAEPQGAWAIDANSTIVEKQGVAVKSANVKNIVSLIGEDSKYKDAFANGTFTHSFLNVNDYHRYHFPVGGTIKEVRIIQGINPTGGIITWDAAAQRYSFDPSSVNWQMLETRGCVIVETKEYGLVALLPIGMAAVGSVNFEPGVVEGPR